MYTSKSTFKNDSGSIISKGHRLDDAGYAKLSEREKEFFAKAEQTSKATAKAEAPKAKSETKEEAPQEKQTGSAKSKKASEKE